MTSKMNSRPHATRGLTNISLTLFASVVIGYVIGLILSEYRVVTVRKNVLDNGLNSGAFSPTGTDSNINNRIGAAHNVTSHFTHSLAQLAVNDYIVLASTVAIKRIESENMFDRRAQSPHLTPQPASVLGYLYDVIWDRIGFDCDANDIFECYFDKNYYFTDINDKLKLSSSLCINILRCVVQGG